MTRGGKRAGAGRPKTETVIYYRRVQPNWVNILDTTIERLKKMNEEKRNELEKFINKAGNFIYSKELEQAVIDDWRRKENKLEQLQRQTNALTSAVKYKNVDDAVVDYWNNIQDLCEALEFSNDEYIELGDCAEELENLLYVE